MRGQVQDQQGAVVPGATVTVRNVDTNAIRTTTADDNGQFLVTNLSIGNYELTIELSGFTKYVRTGLLGGQSGCGRERRPAGGGIAGDDSGPSDASVLNTTSAEVGVRFDTKRIAELPVINSRDVFSVALSAPGVSQLGAGQSEFASGVNFSSNGMRVRSNNFMIDGQDSNDPSVTGRQQWMNNTDVIQEVRLITNQFAAEYGPCGRLRGERDHEERRQRVSRLRLRVPQQRRVNARSNLDKAAGRDKAPFRLRDQYGGTMGGPVLRDRTFFFGRISAGRIGGSDRARR